MCVPDLLGSQGTFLLFTTRPSDESFKEGGVRVALQGNGNHVEGKIEGPENMFRQGNPPLALPLSIDLDREAGRARVAIDGEVVELEKGRC